MRSRQSPSAKDSKAAPKSGKQRSKALRERRREKLQPPPPRHDPRRIGPTTETAPCNTAQLAPYNSYGQPAFVASGYYIDQPFTCMGCGKEEVWRATQQKWWYEVAKGDVNTTAIRCCACRRAKREASAASRKVHLEGLARVGKKPIPKKST
jgi:hypothetical protein